MKRQFAGDTDIGLVRAVNQDSYYIDDQGRFFIVADGMGGHAGGQEASRIATETVRSTLERQWDDEQMGSPDLLRQAIEGANHAILEDQHNHPERSEMGTTIVVVLFREDGSWCAHVGDSRLYRLREKQLQGLTRDHTWVSWAQGMNLITAAEASVHPWRHVLSQCLGRKELNEIEVQALEICEGDVLLLCSDGLTGEVSEEEIRTYLATSPSCEEAVRILIKAAKEGGGSDNITAIAVAAGEKTIQEIDAPATAIPEYDTKTLPGEPLTPPE